MSGLSSVVLALAAALTIAAGAVRLRGTTLVAPALWAVGSVLAIGGVDLLAAVGWLGDDPASPGRYVAATTVLCPMMAVLGAKRPQDRAWQWVVVALLATLWLPAASAAFVHGGESMHLSPAWLTFVAVLVLLGPLNYLPTRNWLPAMAATAGQVIVFAPFVAPAGWSFGEWTAAVAITAFLVATGMVWLRTWRCSRADEHSQGDRLEELNATWLRFRDAFGAFWAIRVMQRVNQGVASVEPPITLKWHGWEGLPGDDDKSPGRAEEIVRQVAKLTRTSLRRFAPSKG